MHESLGASFNVFPASVRRQKGLGNGKKLPAPQIFKSHIGAAENSGIRVLSYSIFIRRWPAATAYRTNWTWAVSSSVSMCCWNPAVHKGWFLICLHIPRKKKRLPTYRLIQHSGTNALLAHYSTWRLPLFLPTPVWLPYPGITCQGTQGKFSVERLRPIFVSSAEGR